MPDLLQRIVGLIGSVLTLPFIALACALVRLESPGPAIHRAVRIGQGGRPFVCYKLRTMRWIPDGGGSRITGAEDARVTRLGRLLRRTRLDELPQLWNVALGQMLLVGPRPEDPEFVDLSDPCQRFVLAAKPGITGPTQLAFRDEAALLDPADPEGSYVDEVLPRKLASDAEYLRNRSPAGDLAILARTMAALIGSGRRS